MEWVETTGKTVEAAKEAALDRLGVDEQDAEFEIIEEPRAGLFGRTRGEGRVRARVIPKAPRPKPERRRRSAKDKRGSASTADTGSDSATAASSTEAKGTDESSGSTSSGNRNRSRQRNRGGQRSRDDRSQQESQADDAAEAEQSGSARRGSGGERKSGGAGRSREGRSSATGKEREVMEAAAQCEVVVSFLDGLGEAFGLEITTSASIEDDVLLATIDGSEVGLFIGPGLGTLEAIQEIARNVLQRHADGREYAKVLLDVAGVRERRRTQLAAFVSDAAQQVLDDGVEVAFEVMSSPDRKVVHDTVGEIDGVASSSIGEDPRRRVVLKPA